MVKLFRKNSNLCDHNSPTLQTDGRTDRQTDRRHAIARPRFALTSASRGKNRVRNCGMVLCRAEVWWVWSTTIRSTLNRHQWPWVWPSLECSSTVSDHRTPDRPRKCLWVWPSLDCSSTVSDHSTPGSTRALLMYRRDVFHGKSVCLLVSIITYVYLGREIDSTCFRHVSISCLAASGLRRPFMAHWGVVLPCWGLLSPSRDDAKRRDTTSGCRRPEV